MERAVIPVITGPTASGKGKLAVALARRLDAEIVSVDSMKVYRRMDVGTAKPSAEVRREIPYHLIDVVDCWRDFSVGEYLRQVLDIVDSIEARDRRVILQGGTAFYLNALINGLFEGPEADWSLRRELAQQAEERGLGELHEELVRSDPEAASKIHANDRRRIVRALEVIRQTGRKMSDLWKESSIRLEPGTYRCFAVDRDRAELYRRIEARVDQMVDLGLFEEVRELANDPRGLSRTASKCIGYRQVIEGIAEQERAEVTISRIKRDTRRFAKQQLTWFRRLPIEWLQPGDAEDLAAEVLGRLGG